MKTSCKGTFSALVILALVVFATSIVKADFNSYVTSNQTIDTFSINDAGKTNWIAETPMYGLFNSYFGTDYASSNAIINDSERNVVVSNNWIAAEGAAIYGVYKVAGYAHSLSFVDDIGNTKLTQKYDGNTQTSGAFTEQGANGVALGYEGEFSMVLKNSVGSKPYETVYADHATLNGKSDNLIHMIAIDVTDLMIAKLTGLGQDTSNITSAYLFGWEDMFVSATHADYDYQDLAYILINVSHESDSYTTSSNNATPEPATALIFAIGMVVYPVSRSLRNKKNG